MKKKRVAILQSNYLPWKGYFDIINSVDLFIFYDDVQYTKGDWRNRNYILSSSGKVLLTIPIGKQYDKKICEVEIRNDSWQINHFKSITQNYSRCKYFDLYIDFFEKIYLNMKWSSLSKLNQYVIKMISSECLYIDSEFDDSRNYALEGQKSDRVLDLCLKSKANVYLSGPSGANYLDDQKFHQYGISIEYFNYEDYPEYPQKNSDFVHDVSIIDLLFNAGPDSKKYMKSFI